jgi:hypothetical protein
MSIDWELYQKCSQVCGAGQGEPCIDQASAHPIAGRPGAVRLTTRAAAAPHSPRKLRAAAARAGGDR